MAILATIGLHGKLCRPTPTGRWERSGADLRGALMDGCRLRLEGRTAGRRAMTAMLSRDGRSLYASWDDPAGYLAVHR
jgi:hypothetical protein